MTVSESLKAAIYFQSAEPFLNSTLISILDTLAKKLTRNSKILEILFKASRVVFCLNRADEFEYREPKLHVNQFDLKLSSREPFFMAQFDDVSN